MIETVAQFLEEFKTKGLEQIKSKDSDIKHTVTIGDIHEGLTSEILNRSIFKGLDLKIVKNSFIYNESGHLSKEMDCMIVIGDGWIFRFKQCHPFRFMSASRFGVSVPLISVLMMPRFRL